MPLLWLSISFLAGIWLTAALGASSKPVPGLGWLALAAAACAWLALRQLVRRWLPAGIGGAFGALGSLFGRGMAWLPKAPLPLSSLLVALTLGAARYQFALPDLEDPGFIASYNDSPESLTVLGVLIEPPDVRDTYVNLRLKVEALRPAEEGQYTPVEGLLLVRASALSDWRYGDRLRLQGHLQTPPEFEDFSYREYLARQGIYSYMANARLWLVEREQGNPVLGLIYALKARALEMVYRLYPDPEASLLAGILLGVESGIPADVRQAFRDTGTAHVIAISGFNVAIIGGLFASLFLRLLGARRRFLAASLSAAAIAFYAVLVGAQPSVVRAAIMGSFSLFAAQLGRRQDGLNSLALVAALMAVFTPLLLWDVSFQLSFMATLGLVLYASPLAEAFTRLASSRLPAATAARLAKAVGEYLLFTVAAFLTTMPVIAYHFRSISLSAFLANPLILPAQPPIMTLGGLSAALGLLWQPLGQLLAYLTWPFAAYTIRVVELLAQFRSGVILLGEVPLAWVLAYYAALLLATTASRRLKNAAALLKPSLALAGLSALTVVVWQVALRAPDGRLHLIVLDVDSGEALLIQTPGGRALLVNGGSSAVKLSESLGRRLPLFHRRLDWLVVAAPGAEQIGALPQAMERFPPAQALWAGDPMPNRAARRLQAKLAAIGIEPATALPGQAFDLGEGALLRVLKVGEKGAVLALDWDNFRALLPLGMDEAMLGEMLTDPTFPPATALLLADGGAAALNPPEWIKKLHPQVVLLSAAATDPQTLEALQGYTLLRTDRDGWIQLTTDGQRLWVDVEKSPSP